jgi:NAD-specific glutamate dehydrogenase
MKCIVAADRILNTDTMREQLRRLDTTASCSTFTRLWLDLGVALRAAAEWLLQYHGATHSLRDMVKLYSSAFDTLTQHANTVFSGAALSRFESRVQEYQELGVSHDEAVHLSLYRRVLPMLEVLWSAREFGHDVQVVAGVFAQVLDDLGVNTLFQYEDRIEPSNKWERELISGAYHEIRRALSLITGEILGAGIVGTPAVRAALHTAPGYEGIRTTMLDITETARQQRPFQAAVLPVISRQLRTFTIARGARESS